MLEEQGLWPSRAPPGACVRITELRSTPELAYKKVAQHHSVLCDVLHNLALLRMSERCEIATDANMLQQHVRGRHFAESWLSHPCIPVISNRGHR